MKNKKNIAILGSTGSIGTQTLDIIRDYPDKFCVEVLVANNNIDLLVKQAREFIPNMVITANKDNYQNLSEALKDLPIKVFAGSDSVAHAGTLESVDVVVAAMVGFSGLVPTLNAIKSGKRIALANKETLVVAGELIIKALKNSKSHIIPVDSEHSAIFQSLNGEHINTVDKIILTASGGPFRGKDLKYLENVNVQQALKHPNWTMGKKVSIDSASMMNKGLEVIEAFWLFGLPSENIEVIVHPQSVIHSLVEFVDGSLIAQLGVPNMRVPIQYALDYPHRSFSSKHRFKFTDYPELSFEKADIETFKCLKLAYDVLNQGGNSACILNAANEIAVDLFLQDHIKFTDIPIIIEECLNQSNIKNNCSLDDYLETDKLSRIKSLEISKNLNK